MASRLTWLPTCARVHVCVRVCVLREEELEASGRSIRDSHPQSPATVAAAPFFLRSPWGEGCGGYQKWLSLPQVRVAGQDLPQPLLPSKQLILMEWASNRGSGCTLVPLTLTRLESSGGAWKAHQSFLRSRH